MAPLKSWQLQRRFQMPVSYVELSTHEKNFALEALSLWYCVSGVKRRIGVGKSSWGPLTDRISFIGESRIHQVVSEGSRSSSTETLEFQGPSIPNPWPLDFIGLIPSRGHRSAFISRPARRPLEGEMTIADSALARPSHPRKSGERM